MYKWYCDDSALKKNHGDEKRPVFLYGGILISREDEIALSNIMKKIKSEYTGEHMPFKYNIKDVEEVYQRFDKQAEFENLKKDSVAWRKRIIEESLKFDYKIFISVIENFQPDKKDQKEIKQNLSSFMFSNALMRVGLYADEKSLDYIQVILDWPEGNDSKPFDKEYFYAYNKGINSNSQEYYCGSLNQLNFDQTLYYARCHHSNLLQLADIIMGATRDWMETELQGREYSIGKELTQSFFSKFYGYPGKILGRGINVSSKNASFKKFLLGAINKNIA
jgi:uncharacterized protein DUF3800